VGTLHHVEHRPLSLRAGLAWESGVTGPGRLDGGYRVAEAVGALRRAIVDEVEELVFGPVPAGADGR
jgi:hypothetical protein